MTELIRDGYGIQAQDINQLLRGRNYSVVNGCEVTDAASAMAVDVAAGSVNFEQDTIEVAEQTDIPIDAAAADPRKDIVYVDRNGDVQIISGNPETAQPTDQTRRDTYRPAPPDLADVEGVVLAEIWVPANADDITGEDISDRRQLYGSGYNVQEADTLSVAGWSLTDVGNHGFNGDRTGGDLAQFIADNTAAGSKDIFVLPEGTYDWNRKLEFTGDSGGTYDEDRPDTIMIIGKPEATIHVDIGASVDQRDRIMFQFGTTTSGIEKVSLQNLHIDVGDANEDRDAGIARTYIEDWAYFKNITMSRRHRVDSTDATIKNGNRFTLKVDCINQDATAVMDRVKLMNGDVHMDSSESVGHAIPFSSEDPHIGTNYWVDCYVNDFTDNGFYVRDGHGSNILQGCTAKDCAAGNFRLGLGDRIENCTSIAENPAYNCCPLWIEVKRETVDRDAGETEADYVEGDEKSEAIKVDGIDIHVDTTDSGNVNDVIRVSSNIPEVVIRNGFIHCETDDFLVDASAHSGSLRLENLHFDDRATGDIRLGAFNFRMDNITMEDCTYRGYPPGTSNGRSIFIADAQNITIKDCDLRGAYHPMVETYSGAELTMVDNRCTHDGSVSSPYVIRNNDTAAIGYVSLRHNDFTDYTGGLGLSIDAIDEHQIVGNQGIGDEDYLGDFSTSGGIVPNDVQGDTLPSDTVPGRILYDSSREQ